MAIIIDGKTLAQKLRKKIAQEVAELKGKKVVPGLAVVMVGGHPSSQIYVRNKQKACDEAGIFNFLETLPASVTEAELLNHIDKLNNNPKVHGILVQLPLPPSLNTKKILSAIDPKKDVDGLHPLNMGRLMLGLPGPRPCTPQGVIAMIESTGFGFEGKSALVLGRSEIVGKPTALLLVEKNATVTICHSKTKDLPEKIGRTDILVVAMGRPRFVEGGWIKKGAVVIDVGINRLPDGTICGDVDFETAKKNAAAISPVPGGVGPMTIAMLLKNTVQASRESYEKNSTL